MINHKKKFCHFCSSPLSKKFIEGRNRLLCLKCLIPIYENPIPASCVVLVNTKYQILLVKRKTDPKKGSWCLPGGFIEIGEAPQEAAKRELEEETGLNGIIDKLIGVSSSNEITFHSIIVISYLITRFYGTLSPGDDALDASFFNLNKLPTIAFKNHKDFIKTYSSKYFISQH